MKLSPKETDKLGLHEAGCLAQKRLARGTPLNYTEATALIASQVLEFVRDGKSVAELMDIGKQLLGRRNVLSAVYHLLDVVQVEGTFPDGTKLVTIHHPISREHGDLSLALYGSFLPVPDKDIFPPIEEIAPPGEIITSGDPIIINKGRKAVRLTVASKCDRPIQIGSHYHFIETNPYLYFDRKLSFGFRLNILPGTAVRFEPGEKKSVTLVSIGGKKIIRGGNGLVDGEFSAENLPKVMENVQKLNFGNVIESNPIIGIVGEEKQLTVEIDRDDYASVFGPTKGDRIRLADTELFAEIEEDYTVYGDECVFGGGKVLREGMGQATGYSSIHVLDTVITNAIIIDHTCIIKADVGIKGNRIVGIGKAGNPDVMDGVNEKMIVGVNTEVIAGEGKILTAGGIDTHIHFICPQLFDEAICSGITTLIGGGTGPAHGSLATTCTPSPYHLATMLKATDEFSMNVGFTGKGNTSKPEGLVDIIRAGAIGLKLHEDWGTTPAAIDNCLSIADEYDIQVTIHTDTLNESACIEHTIDAFKGRTIHTYHSEGAGGGHAPDIIKVCGQENVLPSSTNPTRPFTENTIDEHLDMLMVCHHLDSNNKEDVAFAESRIRSETIQAEDILHDMGAISMMSSDSQAMGRIGEVICRTWQTAHKMKVQRGKITEDAGSENDNYRIKRYVAKYTINPAISHGCGDLLGSVEVGKFADLVLWHPGFFGIKPEMVLKGGIISHAQMGDANASIPTPEPVLMRPQFGASGKAVGPTSIALISKECYDSKVYLDYELSKQVFAIHDVRKLTKKDMKLNHALPKLEVNPETYKVYADGVLLTCEPAEKLPLAQNYILF